MLRSKKAREREERLRQEEILASITRVAPELPAPRTLREISPFGASRPYSIAITPGKVRNSSPANRHSRSQTTQPRMASSSSINFSSPNPYRSQTQSSLPRTESMVSRGRETYAPSISASVHSPRKMRRRKDPEAFNVLVVGAKGSGKTSFVELVKTSLALPLHKQTHHETEPLDQQCTTDRTFTPHRFESELNGERMMVTLWDSPGLEQAVIDLQLRDLAYFVESKFDETFTQESRVVRTPGVKDTHIHCVLLLLDPNRLDSALGDPSGPLTKHFSSSTTHALDQIVDLQVLRTLEGIATVIPVIAKADTLTSSRMTFLKQSVWAAIKRAKLDPLAALSLDDEDGSDVSYDSDAHDSDQYGSELDNYSGSQSPPQKVTENVNSSNSGSHTESPMPEVVQPAAASTPAKRTDSCDPTAEDIFLPFSVLSPDSLAEPGSLTRKFPWGEADPHNSAHCDYTRLRDCIFSDWRSDLREASREKWYENWRTNRLKRNPQARVRQSGGVTPIGLVPKEGRTVSPTITSPNRPRATTSPRQTPGNQDENLMISRSMTSSSKAERVLGHPRGVAL